MESHFFRKLTIQIKSVASSNTLANATDPSKFAALINSSIPINTLYTRHREPILRAIIETLVAWHRIKNSAYQKLVFGGYEYARLRLRN